MVDAITTGLGSGIISKIFGSPKPAATPIAPKQSDAAVQDAARDERRKLLTGRQGTITGAGLLNQDTSTAVKQKTLLGG